MDGILTERVIGCAIEVHRVLGPGLLESVYEACLCRELQFRGLSHESQVAIPVVYRDIRLEIGFRIDVVVEASLLIEIKAVEKLARLHEAQILTYLRLSGLRVGLLMNFNGPRLMDGLKRYAL